MNELSVIARIAGYVPGLLSLGLVLFGCTRLRRTSPPAVRLYIAAMGSYFALWLVARVIAWLVDTGITFYGPYQTRSALGYLVPPMVMDIAMSTCLVLVTLAIARGSDERAR